MKPSVGRIVHWVEDFGEVCSAALVIATNDGPDTNCPNEPDLAVFTASASSSFSLVSVERRIFAPMGALTPEDPPRWSHGWHWPEREPEESDVAHADAPSPLRAEGAPDEGARVG